MNPQAAEGSKILPVLLKNTGLPSFTSLHPFLILVGNDASLRPGKPSEPARKGAGRINEKDLGGRDTLKEKV